MLLKTNELLSKRRSLSYDLGSKGNGLERGRAPGSPGKLSVDGSKLPGVPRASQMQPVGEVETFLEPEFRK